MAETPPKSPTVPSPHRPFAPADHPVVGGREWALEVGDRPSSLVIYRIVHFLGRVLLHRYLRVGVRNAEALELSGPLILAPVHRSHLDSVLVATSCKRRLRALGKDGLFARRGVRYLCAALGAVPVRRGAADREALKAAKGLLEGGAALFVFPEGARISADNAVVSGDRRAVDTVQTLFDGAAWLAARTGAPVVPIGLAGTADALGAGHRWLGRSTVRLVVGEPMTVWHAIAFPMIWAALALYSWASLSTERNPVTKASTEGTT